jgi:putative ABC transport system ATP-binding protein
MLSKKKMNEFRKNNVGFVFQNFELMDWYNVYENVEVPLLAKNIQKRKEIIKEKLELVGISELIKKYPSQLSGGEKQRCAIARALASGNNLILADEPTGSLDHKTGQMIMELFKVLNKAGKTIVIITHDREIASQCHRIIEISDGKIVE